MSYIKKTGPFVGTESVDIGHIVRLVKRKQPIDIQTFIVGTKISAEVLVLNLVIKVEGEFDTIPEAIANAELWVKEHLKP